MNSRHLRPAPARAVAPIHRAPQALPAATGASPFHHAPNAALLIDFDNVTMGIRSDLQTELRHLLASDIIKGKVAVQRAYADWRRYPQYIVPLAESSIDMIMAPAYGSSKKNATDIRLAVDAIELVFTRPEIGTYILLSGDSDFASLVTKLKEYGKYVICVGIRESSSDLLVMNCDEYYSYNSLAGLVNTKEEDSAKRDPWELAAEAIHRMKKNGDVMRSDRLKQVMQEIDSSFDEKDLKISKFSRFCMEAAEKGILTVTKMENGQLEVDIGPGKAMSVTTGVPALARGQEGDGARPASEERSRRGRRGGRGRGRDREARTPVPTESAEPREASETGMPESESASSADMSLASAPLAIDEMVLPPASPRPAASHHPRRTRPQPVSDDIGVSGERLTRDEAFTLVKRAVGTLVSGDDSVPASRVRAAARDLLGRDSESLSERNFIRILRDSHDADMIDLRKRGDDYDVAPAASAAPVSDQLSAAAAAAAAAAPSPAAGPVAPRGMGPRGIGAAGRGGRRGFAQRPASVSPDLLLGAVMTGTPPSPIATPAPALAAAERGVEAGALEVDETAVVAAPASRRKRAAKAPSRAAKTSSARGAKSDADAGATPAKPRSRRGAKKPASGREG